MRWVVLSLVLVNVMFFSWQYIVPPVNSSVLESGASKIVTFQSLDGQDQSSSTITLLEEVKSIEVIKPSVNLDAESTNSPDDDALCYWAGPVNESVDLELLVGRLKGLQVETNQYVERVANGKQYWWVLLPSLDSRELANIELERLQSQGFDSYLIMKGSRVNGISLGLYTQEKLASEKIAEMKLAGWDAVTDVYTKTISQSWLSVDKKQLDAVGVGILPRMLKNKSGVAIIEKKCDLPVASHSNIH